MPQPLTPSGVPPSRRAGGVTREVTILTIFLRLDRHRVVSASGRGGHDGLRPTKTVRRPLTVLPPRRPHMARVRGNGSARPAGDRPGPSTPRSQDGGDA